MAKKKKASKGSRVSRVGRATARVRKPLKKKK
jgi:hypothetical protein